MNLAEFVIRVEAENANVDIALLRRAYEFSDAAHKGQVRESGEPYVNHCLAVAMILAEQHLDTATIAAGMIHDVVEDTVHGLDAVRNSFGDEIAVLVDGVTKISGMQSKSLREQQVEYFRKMLISMAHDIRVIVIKLADRLHNMRTLEYLDESKRRRIAEETRDVYGPLAHRFGMARIKWELEDLALKYLEPDAFEDLVRRIELKREEREAHIEEIKIPLAAALDGEGVEAEITGRAKHLASIRRKMLARDMPLEEIYDLLAVRVITRDERDCYHVLGVVHSLWTPVIDRFHDYVATPKSNMYQSLHTTVIGPRGRMVEIQIRTRTMHRTAEFGVAAHWLYKEGKQSFDDSDRQMNWLREVLEWQQDTRDPGEFLDFLKTDLFQDEVFIFTPHGELVHLPRSATPIDFAYAVHTEVGHHCTGARVNGRIVSLTHALESGDEVEIITAPQAHPSRDWLAIARTTRARSKIRGYLRKTGFDQSLELGRDLLQRELKRLHIAVPKDAVLTDWAMAHSFPDAESLLAALGNGMLSVKALLHKVHPGSDPQRTAAKTRAPTPPTGTTPRGIRIQNLDNMMFRFALCCQPVPGERIIGYITRGRGVTVHRVDCANIAAMGDQSERSVAVEWDVAPDQAFRVAVKVTLENRKNLLRDITQAISDAEINIRSVSIDSESSIGTGNIVLEVRNLRELADVMKRIRSVPGTLAVERAAAADNGTPKGNSGSGNGKSRTR